VMNISSSLLETEEMETEDMKKAVEEAKRRQNIRDSDKWRD